MTVSPVVVPKTRDERPSLERHQRLRELGIYVFVKGAAGIDPMVGDPDFLDLFQVEQPLVVGQGVQGHDARAKMSG